MADKQKILELDIDVESIISKSSQLKVQLEQLVEKQERLKKAGDTSSEAYVKNAASISKVSTEYRMNQQQLANLSTVSGKYLTVQEKMNLAVDKEITSIDAARANNAELLKIRNSLNLSSVDGAKAAESINQKLDENNKFIKENVSAYEKQKIGIGDYKTAISDALSQTSLFGGSLDSVVTAFKPFSGVFQMLKKDASEAIIQIRSTSLETSGMSRAQAAAAITTNVVSGSLKLLKVALIGTGIGAIVVLLGSLIAYLTGTQAGIDKVTSVTRPLQAIFSGLVGILETLGGKLISTFSNPKKVLTDLADFVKQNLINRFKAFGEILDGIITLDFKKVTNGVLQAGTGVENLTDKIANGAKATGDFLSDAAKKGAEIDRITKEIAKSQLEYNKNQIAVNDAIDEQLLISKDTSKSFAERAAASREIIRLSQANGDQEARILQLKLQQLQAEQSLKGEKNLTNEDKQKTIDLLVEIDEAEDRGLNARLEQTRVLSGLEKEKQAAVEAAEKKAQEVRQKTLDDAARLSKAQLDLFLSEVGIRAKSMQDELYLAEQVRDKKLKIAQDEFEASKKTEADKLKLLTDQNNIKNEFNQKQVDATIANAQHELDLYIKNNQSKRDNDKYFSEESLKIEQERLQGIFDEKQKFFDLELEQGAINQQVYDDAINAVKEENRINNEAIKAQRDEAQKETDLLNAQNQIALDEQSYQDKYALETARLKIKKDEAIANAKAINADTTVIEKLYAGYQKDIDREKNQAKMDSASAVFGGIADLLGRESALGKAAAVTQSIINVAQGVTKAIAEGGLMGIVTGALVAVSGGLSIAKIISTKPPEKPSAPPSVKLARGGRVKGPGTSTSDSIPAQLSNGETVINAKSSDMFAPLLSAMNVAGGGVSFAKGQIQYPAMNQTVNSSNSQSMNIDYDLLAAKIGENVAQANLNLPAPVVSVEEINNGQANYARVVDSANL